MRMSKQINLILAMEMQPAYVKCFIARFWILIVTSPINLILAMKHILHMLTCFNDLFCPIYCDISNHFKTISSCLEIIS